MKFGKLNVAAGAIGLLIGACGGMALGLTFDQYAAKDGYHVLSLIRFYFREGHSHGMPFALYNLLFGLLIDRLSLSDKLKKAGSILALCTFILPLGLLGKALSGASPDFPPIGVLGAIALMGSLIIILMGIKKAE
jgi:hypothetical protein